MSGHGKKGIGEATNTRGLRCASMEPDVSIRQTLIEVMTGEVRASSGGVLNASAIGSCVVVAMYDSEVRVGGLAHIMLPGASPGNRNSQHTRYAEDAVTELGRMLAELGADTTRTDVCLVGGGDIVGDGDGLGDGITRSVTEALKCKGVAPVATEVGGTQRRSCSLDVARGRVTYTVGDLGPHVLWEARDGCRVRMSSEMSADKSPTRQEG